MRDTLKWVAGTAVVAVLAALAIYPKPRAPGRETSNEAERASEAWRASNRDLFVLRRIASLATAFELARALPAAPPLAVTFKVVPPVNAASAAGIERILRNELATVAPAGPRHPVAVVVTADSIAAHGSYIRTIVIPEASTQPCTVVFGVSARGGGFPGIPATDRLLGTCGFYAAFGRPGREIERWLAENRARNAEHFQRPAALTEPTGPTPAPRFGFVGDRVALVACSAGRAYGCEQLLQRSPIPYEQILGWWVPSRELYELEATAVPRAVTFPPGTSANDLDWVEAGLLSAMAVELGAEQFSRIWRDDRPLPEAFEAAEGRPLLAWTRQYVARHLEPYRPGPGIPPLAMSLALGLIVLAAYGGTRFARREMS